MVIELDDDGYPSEECLASIAAAKPAEGQQMDEWCTEMLDQIRPIWQYADWGWSVEEGVDDRERPCQRWNISTAGWSGNESIIAALRGNIYFWSFSWVQTRRGGHYIFETAPRLAVVVSGERRRPMWDDQDPDFQQLNFNCQATPGTTLHFTMRSDECLISSAPYRFEGYFDLSLQDQEKLYAALGRNLECRRRRADVTDSERKTP